MNEYDDIVKACDAAQTVIQAHVPDTAVVEMFLETSVGVSGQLRVSITEGVDVYWATYRLTELTHRSSTDDGFGDYVVANIPVEARK